MHECAHRLLSIAVSPAPSSEMQALMQCALDLAHPRRKTVSRARATVRAIADFVNIAYISVPPWVIEEGGWTRDDGVGR